MIETYYNRFMKGAHDTYFPNNNFYENTFKSHMMNYLSLSDLTKIKKTNEEYSEYILDSLNIMEYIKQFYLEEQPQ